MDGLQCPPVMMACGVGRATVQALVGRLGEAVPSTLPARSVARAWKVQLPAGRDKYSCSPVMSITSNHANVCLITGLNACMYCNFPY